MYKKIIAYALVYMSYHGIYVAIDFYDDSSPNRSYPILQSSNGDTIFFNMNDTSARSSNNDTDASCVFGHSNTTDQFNQSTNLNEAYRNPGKQKTTAAHNISPSLAQLAHSNRFIKSLYDMQLAGDVPGLQQLALKLKNERKKCTGWFSGAKRRVLDWKMKQVKEVLADPITIRLHTIKTGDLIAAMEAFSEFPLAQFFSTDGVPLPSRNRTNITTAVAAGQASQVVDHSSLLTEFNAAKQFLRSRPDYQAYVKTQQKQKVLPAVDGYYSLPIPPEVRSVRASMIEALMQSTQQEQLANTIDGVRCEIFDLARYHNYEVYPEVEDQVHVSIGVIRGTRHEHEIVFHVAIVDRVLGDVQTQLTGQQIPDQPSLLKR